MKRLLWVVPTLGLMVTGKERLVESILKTAPDEGVARSIVLTPVPYGSGRFDNKSLKSAGNYAANDFRLQRLAEKRSKGDTVVLPFGTLASRFREQVVAGLVLDDFFGVRHQGHTVTSRLGGLYRGFAVPAFARRADFAWVTDPEVPARVMFRRKPARLAPGVDLDVFRLGAVQTVARPGSFVLTMGGTAARKNAGAQARAVVAVAQDLGLDAVGVGFFPTRVEGLRVLGRVSDEMLAALFRDAASVLLAPIAEGWGLPVLEALSMGAKVAASYTPSIANILESIEARHIPHLQLVQDPTSPRALMDGVLRAVEASQPTDPSLEGLRRQLDMRSRTQQFWETLLEVTA